MCGIAGIFLSNNADEATFAHCNTLVENVLSQQSYRGPDFKSIEHIKSANQQVILGHNRLKIIDLSSSSNQPMWDESKRYCIVYNGMLYNYVELKQKLQQRGFAFFSEGDTEVVLKSFMNWGIDAFNFFNGMFAIAIYDAIEEKLFLIRDRFGIKPLFYCYLNDKVYFASTSAELARQLRLQPNLAFLAKGLTYWCYDQDSDSAYENLMMVAPGEVITFASNRQGNAKKYYCLATKVDELIADLVCDSPQTIIERTKFILDDAITLRLRSDVPIGISLSGGVDSATIAGIAKTKLIDLSAFSFGSLQNPHSEAVMTKLTAEKIGVNLHFVYPTQKEMQAAFWKTLQLQDAPFPNLSIVAQNLVFNVAQERGIKVMLGGQGGDEIFMGYRKYCLFYLSRLMSEKKYLTALHFITHLMPSMMSEIAKVKTYLFNFQRYTKGARNTRWRNFSAPMKLIANPKEPLWQRQVQDIYALSLPTLLRYEDRNSMGNSIESRLPFLDYRLVELALALPETLKLHRGYGKWILRKISQPYLPNKVSFSRNKRGFDVNSRAWITSGLGESLRQCLSMNPAMLKAFNLEGKIANIFSDERLASPSNISECITLAWLAEKNFFIWS